MIDGYIFFTKWEYCNLNAGIPIFFAPKPPILAGKPQAIRLLTVIILINIPHKKISLTLLIPGLIVLPKRHTATPITKWYGVLLHCMVC